MKLEPIAKPIKIRIKIGDKEYSDFDSVKNNFSAQELYPLFKDGRLERWLRQIGKDTIANSVQETSQKCGDGSMQDYILFLSVFFDEIADILNGKEFTLDSFMANMSLDLLKLLFPCMKDGAEWKVQLDKVLSISNYKDIFEDKSLHTIFSDKDEWGIKLASLAKNENDYKELFEYIEQSVNVHPEYEDVLRNYFYTTFSNGFCWENIYKGYDLDYIYKLYQNAFMQKIDSIDWGMIFAESMRDWDRESKKIESTLKKNPTHLTSFYKCCADKGIQAAINKTIDQWKNLVESEDYVNVKKALNNWNSYMMSPSYRDYDYLSKYNYYHMKSSLGKEILDFLNSLRKNVWDDNHKYVNFLEEEKNVMMAVQDRQFIYYNSYRDVYKYSKASLDRLQEMKNQGVTLAEYVLSDVDRGRTSISEKEIKQEAAELIKNKLKKCKS